MRRALHLIVAIALTATGAVRPYDAVAAPDEAAAAAITVSAAISLTAALQEIGEAYRASGARQVQFNFAASNVLARQIVNGAPADLFISADEAQMDYVQRAGAIDAASRVPLLANRLAIVLAPGRPFAGGAAVLTDPRIRRIAIGDPAAVPAGVYARQYLERADLWDRLQSKLLPMSSVRAALAAVASRGADAGIVYESDVASARVELAAVIEGPAAPTIVYPAAIVARTRNRGEAETFLQFLRGERAASTFRRFKFLVLGGPTPPRTPGPTDP